MNGSPLVSISCITYNHEKYISQAIESFLMQKTSFPFEILIHDDASTDGTKNIIKEYEKNYPDIIFPIYQEVNQFSQNISISATFNWPRSRGKYIAFCEGDDYWTDPYKLQKQVDFLEKNPDYTICCGEITVINDETKEIIKNNSKNQYLMSRFSKEPKGFTMTFSDKKWYFLFVSSTIRKDCLDFIFFSKYKYFRDAHLAYHILKKGLGFFMPGIVAVYRLHKGGIFSLVGELQRKVDSYQTFKDLYEINLDDKTRVFYSDSIKELLIFKLNHKFKENTSIKNSELFSKLFHHCSSFKDISRICIALLFLCKRYLKNCLRFHKCRRVKN